jgi:4-amino-4-deoxy-L-arabinose transferase-like glycosyltransferase
VSQAASPNAGRSAPATQPPFAEGRPRPRDRFRWIGWLRRIPPEALLIGFALFAILAVFAAADPVTGVTNSTSPFTDEAWNLVNARNFVQLGRWSTDEWNLYLVNLPFSLLEVIAFKLFGVGIVQARLAMSVCVSLATLGLVWGLRGVVGRTCAAFAGLAFGFSGLILFYGRLAFLEDLVVLTLTLGVLVLARDSRINLRGGVLSGICFALAIGTKPSALFAVVGIVATMAAVWGWRDAGMRRWIAGCAGMIVAAGLLWLVVVGLPNRAALAIDVKIWPPYQWNLTPASLIVSTGGYLLGHNDDLYSLLLLPLIGLGLGGFVTIVALRERLSEVQARLAACAIAWAAFGFGILMVVSYRPNRYVVPLAPSMAIMAAIGLNLFLAWWRERRVEPARTGVGVGVGVGVESDARAAQPQRRRRATPGAIAGVAIVIAVAPGLAWYGNWARTAKYEMVGIQNQFADVVPSGQIAAGNLSALFLMRSSATTIIVGLANNGDVYAEGARWYLEPIDATAPLGVPDPVWAARVRVVCASWRGGQSCLFHLR